MKNILISMTLVAGLSALTACSTTTSYGDPNAVETVNADWGSTDLQIVTDKLVQSLLSSSALTEKPKPAIALGAIDNRTKEHLDTKLILDNISTALVKSGKVRLIATSEGQSEISQQIAHQQSGAVAADSAKAFGKQVGADYVLYGRLTNIEKKGGSVQDVYFNLNLNLVDVETAVLAWKEFSDIRKNTRKSTFGW